jgi:hypothetical protein
LWPPVQLEIAAVIVKDAELKTAFVFSVARYGQLTNQSLQAF